MGSRTPLISCTDKHAQNWRQQQYILLLLYYKSYCRGRSQRFLHHRNRTLLQQGHALNSRTRVRGLFVELSVCWSYEEYPRRLGRSYFSSIVGCTCAIDLLSNEKQYISNNKKTSSFAFFSVKFRQTQWNHLEHFSHCTQFLALG